MRIFIIVSVLCLALALGACHPSAADKKDMQEGVACGETSIPSNQLSLAKGFKGRSKYFKAGFDYGALKKANQLRLRIMFSKLGDFDDGIRIEYPRDEEKHELAMRRDVATRISTAWTALHEDLAAISMTPEAFSQMVRDDKLPALLAKSPPSDF